MRTAYDRNEAKRLNQEVALDHISIQMELEQVEARQDDDHERHLHEQEELGYSKGTVGWREFEEDMDAADRTQRQMHGKYFHGGDVFTTGLVDIENDINEGSHHALVDDAERDIIQRRSLEKMMNVAPCSFCLGEHHPSANCPADQEVVHFNQTQQDPRDIDDMYYHDEFF